MIEKITDSDLIARHRNGDIEAFNEIYSRYKNMIKGIARSYFLADGDTDDVLQEGLLGLLKAVNTYNADMENASGFSTFAYMCINSCIITAVKKSVSNKNKPLNHYVPIAESEDSLYMAADPEQEIIDIENESELNEKVKDLLSDFEYTVLKLYLAGLSYSEIASKLEINEKSADNALQRIRKKLTADSDRG